MRKTEDGTGFRIMTHEHKFESIRKGLLYCLCGEYLETEPSTHTWAPQPTTSFYDIVGINTYKCEICGVVGWAGKFSKTPIICIYAYDEKKTCKERVMEKALK